MKRILVPTDFSRPAQWAAQVATGIAKRSDGEVVLLHVIDEPFKSFNVQGQVADYSDWEDRVFMAQLIRKTRQRLKEAADEIELAGVKVSYNLRIGNPFHGIREVITSEKCDLVVMGTSGKSKLEEMLIGSNTEKVVRFSKCPVLTVHEKPKGSEFKNIVYATSMSDDEAAFVDVVVNAQEMYDATIHVVRINTPANFRPDTSVLPIMEKFAKKHRLKNYTLNIFNHYTEEEGILHFANTIKADIIAMATHGRKGFARVLAGSIAEDVANHSTKPVLTCVTR